MGDTIVYDAKRVPEASGIGATLLSRRLVANTRGDRYRLCQPRGIE